MTESAVRNISLQIKENEYVAIKRLADFHNKTLPAFLIENILELIEDYEDARLANDVLKSNEPTHSWEDVQRELGLL